MSRGAGRDGEVEACARAERQEIIVIFVALRQQFVDEGTVRESGDNWLFLHELRRKMVKRVILEVNT